MKPSSRDSIYAKPLPTIGSFRFDEKVAHVFDDMIRRSVPGYGLTLSLMSLIAQRYAQPDSCIYDLGCSLGAGMIAMAQNLKEPSVKLIGVDNSPSMLEQCQTHLEDAPSATPFELRQENIEETELENASIVILNFTLQFISLDARIALLQRICQALRPGGVLLLSEKIVFEEDRIQDEMTSLHHDFKRSQGYSDLEISQKRDSLENTLIPETVNIHEERLSAAGFANHERWLHCFNFSSWLAFKK